MYNFEMSSIKKLSIVYLSTIFVLALWAAAHYRVEIVDGSQALFHMMNGEPYRHYINNRTLSKFIQFSAYFNQTLVKSGYSFKTIYYFHNVMVAITPFLIALITTFYLFKLKKQDYLIYYFISFSLSILLTHSFHVSLVPESILFGWLAFFCWQNSYSNWSYLLGIPSAIFLNLAYESSCGFSVFIIFSTLHLFITKRLFLESFKSYFLKILLSLLCFGTIYYRIVGFEQFGILEFSAKQSLRLNYPAFYSFILSLFLFCLLHLKKVNKSVIIFLLIIINLFVTIFVSGEYMQFLSGYHLRVYAFIPAMVILAMLYLNRDNIGKNSKSLIIFCYISLIVFGVNDFRTTKYWEEFRIERNAELSIYNSGCNIIDQPNWEIPYYSMNSQQTFKPAFFVIGNEDNSRCDFTQGPFQVAPKLFHTDHIKNYDFSLFLSK